MNLADQYRVPGHIAIFNKHINRLYLQKYIKNFLNLSELRIRERENIKWAHFIKKHLSIKYDAY